MAKPSPARPKASPQGGRRAAYLFCKPVPQRTTPSAASPAYTRVEPHGGLPQFGEASMLQQYGLWIALACAVVAILYGAFSVSWVLARSPGNERMQEIAAAIQEG